MDIRVIHVARFEFARHFSAKGEIVCLLVLLAITGFKLGGEALMNLGRSSGVVIAIETTVPVDVSDLSTKQYSIRSSLPSERESMMEELRDGRLGALLVPSSGGASAYVVHVADAWAWSEALKVDLAPATFRLAGVAQSVPLSVLDSLREGPALTLKVHSVADSRTEPTVKAASTVLAVILVLSVISTINVTVQAFASEKSGRVCEMVLSTIPIEVWLDGKLIAAALHGLKTGVVYLIYALLAAWAMGFMGEDRVAQLCDHAFTLSLVVVMCVAGGLFWNCAFSAVSAALSTEMSPARNTFVVLPMTALLLVMNGVNEPSNPFMVALSYLPITSMFAMPALLVQGQATISELALSLCVLLAGCWLLRAAAVRAFRSSIMRAAPTRGLSRTPR